MAKKPKAVIDETAPKIIEVEKAADVAPVEAVDAELDVTAALGSEITDGAPVADSNAIEQAKININPDGDASATGERGVKKGTKRGPYARRGVSKLGTPKEKNLKSETSPDLIAARESTAIMLSNVSMGMAAGFLGPEFAPNAIQGQNDVEILKSAWNAKLEQDGIAHISANWGLVFAYAAVILPRFQLASVRERFKKFVEKFKKKKPAPIKPAPDTEKKPDAPVTPETIDATAAL